MGIWTSTPKDEWDSLTQEPQCMRWVTKPIHSCQTQCSLPRKKEWTSFIPEIIATDSAFNEITPSFALLQSILLRKSQSSCSICMIFLKMIFDISRYTEDYISVRKQSKTWTLLITCIYVCHLIHCLLSEERFLMLHLSSSCLFDIVLSHYAWEKYYLVSLVY